MEKFFIRNNESAPADKIVEQAEEKNTQMNQEQRDSHIMEMEKKIYEELISDVNMPPIDVIHTAMVKNGLKPSAWHRWVLQGVDYPLGVYGNDPDKYEEALKKLQVAFRREHLSKDPSGGEEVYDGDDFFVGKNEEMVNELMQAVHNNDEVKMGELLGYPRSSTEYLMKRKFDRTISRAIPETPSDQIDFEIAGFAPSKDHYKEELAFAKEQSNQIRTIIPEIVDAFEVKRVKRGLL